MFEKNFFGGLRGPEITPDLDMAENDDLEDVAETPIKGSEEFEESDELKIVAVGIDDISENERREATEKAIEVFKRVLARTEDYAVIASTALYLHGLLERMPGDFDAVVFSEAVFRDIPRKLLTKTNGVLFYEPFDVLKDKINRRLITQGSPIRVMPDRQAKVISGEIVVLVGKSNDRKAVRYPFEFFFKTRVVPESLRNLVEKKLDFWVIRPKKALETQYALSLEKESRIDKAVWAIRSRLLMLKKKIISKEYEAAVLKRFELTQAELKKYYSLEDELVVETIPEMRARLKDNITRLLSGGFKTKVKGRQESLARIAAAKK